MTNNNPKLACKEQIPHGAEPREIFYIVIFPPHSLSPEQTFPKARSGLTEGEVQDLVRIFEADFYVRMNDRTGADLGLATFPLALRVLEDHGVQVFRDVKSGDFHARTLRSQNWEMEKEENACHNIVRLRKNTN